MCGLIRTPYEPCPACSPPVQNPKGELVAIAQKSTKALIMSAALGAGSEMEIDVAPGVDWTMILAAMMALQQVGARRMGPVGDGRAVGKGERSEHGRRCALGVGVAESAGCWGPVSGCLRPSMATHRHVHELLLLSVCSPHAHAASSLMLAPPGF